jgi:RNA polymerase sigma-70 factor (ECF subfamily)
MDDELVRRAARGDAEAFDALARDRIDRLYAIAYRILRDHHDAEDAVQQALWTAWTDLPGLREPARLDAWLYRLLVRGCYRVAGGRRRRGTIVALTIDVDVAGTMSAATGLETRETIERAFATLGTEHRAVVVLHHYLGLPGDEIAAVLGIPHGTVRSRLHYAMQRLRTAIEADSALDADTSAGAR